jgi:TnpA family transposase
VGFRHRIVLGRQRFGIQKHSLLASFCPRYFGYYDRAVSVYTHISDQFSVFGTRVISCAPREALYAADVPRRMSTLLVYASNIRGRARSRSDAIPW